MKFSIRNSLCLCASTLMLLSVSVPAVSANSNIHSNSPRTQRIVWHIKAHKANLLKAGNLKWVHANNLNRFNRIKRHMVNHQKNLRKIANRLTHARNHSHKHNLKYVRMINRWNNDKARLIHAIETNQRGMVRLAEQVNNERHAINLIKHPNAAKQSNNNVQNNVSANDPADNSSYGSFSSSFYSNDNGKVNQGSAKEIDNNGKISGSASLNGKPVAFNQNTISQFRRHLARFKDNMRKTDQQITNFDNQLDREVKNEINSTFNEFY